MFYQKRPKENTLSKDYLNSLKLHAALLNYFGENCSLFCLNLFTAGVGQFYASNVEENEREYKTAYFFLTSLMYNYRNEAFDYMSECEKMSDIEVFKKYALAVLNNWNNNKNLW